MDKETLLRRKAEIESLFTDYDAEMKRLQGEHRLVVSLLDSPNVPVEVVKPKRIRKVVDAESKE